MSHDHSSSQLRAHGLQVTAQRLAVLRAVAAHPHGTAEIVAEAVRTEIGAISRQAVYDALGTLSDKGLIRRIQPAGSPALFDPRVGDNHHHAVCRRCRTVVDVDCAIGDGPCVPRSLDACGGGFSVDEAEIVFWGLCDTCRPVQDPQPVEIPSD